VWSTLGGVLIFGVLETVFNQLGVNPYLKTVLQGAIIVMAVASYTIRSKKEAA
jgi:ribose transport system permease protein